MENLWSRELPPFPPPSLANKLASLSIADVLLRIVLALKSLVWALLPSYVTNRFIKDDKADSKKPVRLLPTAYLDGLRGLFSIIVFIHHVLLPWVRDVDMGYGLVANRELVDNYNIFKLPLLKTLHGGPTVPIFFVVSGFVMALKPLKLIRKNDYDAFAKAITTSLFRRPLRLFLPPMALTFLTAVACYNGWYSFNYETMPGHRSVHPDQKETFYLQLVDWKNFLLDQMTNGFTWKFPRGDYNSNLWTIPNQFRCSMITFMIIVGLAPTRPRTRGFILSFLWAYCMYMGRWEVSCYIAGIFISERKLSDLQAEEDSEKQIPLHNGGGRLGALKLTGRSRIWWWRCVFLLGWYIGSYPRSSVQDALNTPGFGWMAYYMGKWQNWHTISAMLMVWAMGHDPILQRFFTSPVLRYLAPLSFSIYLVHGPMLHFFGWGLVPRFWAYTGNETEFQTMMGVTLATAVLIPTVVWVADVFSRFVEKPCGKFAGRIEALLLVKP